MASLLPARSAGRRRRAAAAALLVTCILAAVPRAFARDNPSSQTGAIPAAHAVFTLGALQIETHVRPGGTVLDCLIRLSTIPVAAHTLTPEAPNYSFDVVAGNATAKGAFKTIFMPVGQISTVEADLTTTISGQTEQPYRGMVYYWMVDSNDGTARSTLPPMSAKSPIKPRRNPAHTRQPIRRASPEIQRSIH